MSERRERYEVLLRAEFEVFLEALHDVSQLYYTGMISLSEAMKRVHAASSSLRDRQSVLVRGFAGEVAEVDGA